MPPGSVDRERKAREMLALLEQCPAEAPDQPNSDEADEALIARTLDAVRHARQRERFAEQVQMVGEPSRGFSFDWRQAVSAAAIFLIGVSLLLPVLERNRAESQRIACATNLAQAGMAFNSYAENNQGQLPRQPGFAGDIWWDVASSAGDFRRAEPQPSNAANLQLLAPYGAGLQQLSCPAPPDHADSPHAAEDPATASLYSYQDQSQAQPIQLNQHPDMAILADKNPIFEVRVGWVRVKPNAPPQDAPSRVHNQRGQNLLLGDGSVHWTVRPTITRRDHAPDHIWVPDRDANAAASSNDDRATNAPASPDSFLRP